MPFFRRLRKLPHLSTDDNRTVDDVLQLVSDTHEIVASLTSLLRDAARDARETKAELRVIKVVLASLIAHVADESSQQQTINVVLGVAERLVNGLEAEYGPSGVYRETIQELRDTAEARLPKP